MSVPARVGERDAGREPLGSEMERGAQTHAVTDALGALRAGAPGAMDQLVPLVYGELTRIAHRQLGLEATGHTLSTTALVHEAYLRLVDQHRAQWADRVQGVPTKRCRPSRTPCTP